MAAFQACFTARGWDVPESFIHDHFIGRRAPDVFRELDGPWHAVDPIELAAESLTYLDFAANPPRRLPGATAAFESWVGRVPTAIVTSAPRAWAEQAIAIIGGPAPDVLLAADSYVLGKPHPEPFLTACRDLGVDPYRALAFDDAVHGVRSARTAGVGLVVGVTTWVAPLSLIDAGAHATTPHLAALNSPS